MSALLALLDFLLQLAGKGGSFVAASAGNDFGDVFLTWLPSGLKILCRDSIQGLVLLFLHLPQFCPS
jgi:hypothetical protein